LKARLLLGSRPVKGEKKKHVDCEERKADLHELMTEKGKLGARLKGEESTAIISL